MSWTLSVSLSGRDKAFIHHHPVLPNKTVSLTATLLLNNLTSAEAPCHTNKTVQSRVFGTLCATEHKAALCSHNLIRVSDTVGPEGNSHQRYDKHLRLSDGKQITVAFHINVETPFHCLCLSGNQKHHSADGSTLILRPQMILSRQSVEDFNGG